MAKKAKTDRKEIIIDMDEFIVTYAATLMDPSQNLSQIIYDNAKNGLENLDTLFKDNGFGRKNKFINIGKGYLHDNIDAGVDIENIEQLSQDLGKEAIEYLGNNIDFFEKWRTD